MKNQNNRPPQGNHGGGPAIGRPSEKAKDFKGTLKRLIKEFAQFKTPLFIVVIFAILSTMFLTVSPYIMGLATTRIFDDGLAILNGVPGAQMSFDYIGKIVMTLVVLYVLSAIFGYMQQFIMAGISQKAMYNIREKISQKLSKLPLKYYDNNTNGEILSRVTNDVETISQTVQQALTQLLTSIVTMIGILIMMISISIPLTVVAMLVIPISLVVTMIVAPKSQKYFKGQQEQLGHINGHVEEMYTGHRIVKAFGMEEKSVNAFEQFNEKLFHNAWKAQFISGIIMPLMGFIGNLGYVSMAVIGGIMAAKGQILVGNVQAFITYSKQFTQPIVQTSNIANIIQSAVAAAERVYELLDEEEMIPDVADKVQSDFEGNVDFEHVKFGYKEDKILINDLNVDVKNGMQVAIVGPTGAGKTTIVNLLMRFYELNGGSIKIDGIDIRDMSRKALRSQFGMVLQDTWLFHGTIEENIAYGKDGATKEDVIAAAKAAHADTFIRSLPHGYDTVLTEDASNISQGQKQLLTIARAILANPPIMILDEATSSVDTRTEVFIQKAMKTLMNNRTSFVIAHRLSTIKDADMILVIKNGDVIEKGDHKTLLKQNGFYADLYNSQFTSNAIL